MKPMGGKREGSGRKPDPNSKRQQAIRAAAEKLLKEREEGK